METAGDPLSAVAYSYSYRRWPTNVTGKRLQIVGVRPDVPTARAFVAAHMVVPVIIASMHECKQSANQVAPGRKVHMRVNDKSASICVAM